MRFLLLIVLVLGSLFCLSQTNSISTKNRKQNKDEENSFAYMLPYEKGRSFLLVQAYQSMFTHRGEFALDFKMKRGTKICAARGGIVVEVKEDSKKGGFKKKYLPQGNHIIIKHDDGTYGNYWHLAYSGALVHVGDTVKQGQVIGLCGKTGYTAFPHLHFEVTTQFTPGRNQIPTQFITTKGRRYLKPLHRYKSI